MNPGKFAHSKNDDISPEDQLNQLVDEWNNLESSPVDLLKMQRIKGNIYWLCERNDWQLPVLKRYNFE